MKLHVILGSSGCEGIKRRMRCDVCAENVQPKLPRPAVPRQVLDFNEWLGLDILIFPTGKVSQNL